MENERLKKTRTMNINQSDFHLDGEDDVKNEHEEVKLDEFLGRLNNSQKYNDNDNDTEITGRVERRSKNLKMFEGNIAKELKMDIKYNDDVE